MPEPRVWRDGDDLPGADVDALIDCDGDIWWRLEHDEHERPLASKHWHSLCSEHPQSAAYLLTHFGPLTEGIGIGVHP